MQHGHESRVSDRIQLLRVQPKTEGGEPGREGQVEVDSQEEVDVAAGDATLHAGQGKHSSPTVSWTRVNCDLKLWKIILRNHPRMPNSIFYGEASLLRTPSATYVRKTGISTTNHIAGCNYSVSISHEYKFHGERI